MFCLSQPVCPFSPSFFAPPLLADFILTIFGTCVYLYNGVVLLFDEVRTPNARASARYIVHIQ